MIQQTFSDIEYAHRRRKTRREKFLDAMNGLLPFDAWTERIRPHYYRGIRGRRPADIGIMLRMYLVREWYGLSDEGVEETVNDSYAMRKFLGINFLEDKVPDASTLRRFRHFLEKQGIRDEILTEMRTALKEAGFVLHAGSVTDAALTAAPGKGKGRRRTGNTSK